jgi:hypothetical protein
MAKLIVYLSLLACEADLRVAGEDELALHMRVEEGAQHPPQETSHGGSREDDHLHPSRMCHHAHHGS